MNKEDLIKELEIIEQRKTDIEKTLNDKGCFIVNIIGWDFKFTNGQEVQLNQIVDKDIQYCRYNGILAIDVILKNALINFDLIDLFKEGHIECSAIDKYMTQDIFDTRTIHEDYYENVVINKVYFESGNEIGNLTVELRIYL